MRLAYDLNKNIERLRNNISKKTVASEDTMLARLNDIEDGIKEKIEANKGKYEDDIEKLKELIAQQNDVIEDINELNEDSRNILNLYIALTNATQYSGNDNVRIQNIKTIGYIVASYASKDDKFLKNKEVD